MYRTVRNYNLPGWKLSIRRSEIFNLPDRWFNSGKLKLVDRPMAGKLKLVDCPMAGKLKLADRPTVN